MAAAAGVAAAFVLFQIFWVGHAAEFEGLADAIVNAGLDAVGELLGIKETPDNGFIEEGIALFFEGGDFMGGQAFPAHLATLKVLAFALNPGEFFLRGGAGEEGFQVGLEGAVIGIVEDGAAEVEKFVVETGEFRGHPKMKADFMG